MARPLLGDKPLTPAERKRIQRAKSKSTAIECHETSVLCHETTRDYQAEAKRIVDESGFDSFSSERKKYVLSMMLADLASEQDCGLLTACFIFQALPKQVRYDY